MDVHERITKLGGCAVIGLVLVAIVSFAGGAGFVNDGDRTAAALALIACAIACSGIANIVYRR